MEEKTLSEKSFDWDASVNAIGIEENWFKYKDVKQFIKEILDWIDEEETEWIDMGDRMLVDSEEIKQIIKQKAGDLI